MPMVCQITLFISYIGHWVLGRTHNACTAEQIIGSKNITLLIRHVLTVGQHKCYAKQKRELACIDIHEKCTDVQATIVERPQMRWLSLVSTPSNSTHHCTMRTSSDNDPISESIQNMHWLHFRECLSKEDPHMYFYSICFLLSRTRTKAGMPSEAILPRVLRYVITSCTSCSPYASHQTGHQGWHLHVIAQVLNIFDEVSAPNLVMLLLIDNPSNTFGKRLTNHNLHSATESRKPLVNDLMETQNWAVPLP